jgi:hypothetical protein
VHILYLIQYFGTPADPATSDRAYDFVTHFAQAGHNVTLITSDAFISDPNHLNEYLPSNVHVHLIHQPYHNQLGTWQRLVAFVSFWIRAFFRAVQIRFAPDVIYASSTPLSIPLLGALLANLWRTPWVFEIRDLWPDFIFDVGVIQNPILKKALYGLEKSLYRSTSRIISLSPTTTSILSGSKEVVSTKILTLPNGCPYPYPDPGRTKADLVGTELSTNPLVIYAGTFGYANDIDWLISCCDQLLTSSETVIALIGEGNEKTKILNWYVHLKPSYQKRVILKKYVSRMEASDWFWAADFSLITFRNLPSLKATSPNKYFHTLATKTIPVTNHPGWISEEVQTQHIGIAADNPEDVAQQIKSWIQDPTRQKEAKGHIAPLVQRYRRDQMAQNLLQLVSEIIKPL